ncbi:putative DnaK-related protein (molecular chaperone) [Pirellula staleyi DSM 6068]|uniref:Putative DnaK-related protein (Molecular chaperone) n=1 Tax=Pirellula staleyi (strain ATCC 27377 / DSM 6068 / ICPB 4128) TaxID=530564 RepID=D2R0M9_PIRSD|nr:Hsp70 family protein [Pirellula staleyi]ADB16627.1 putative DnaK-related protein (molecular chaperone) [Pirellula staleyi DSM 6068]
MSKFVIGIDLGTTNSVLAYADLGTEKPDVQLLEIPQLVAAGVVEPRSSLPSFLYLPPPGEAESPAYAMPGAAPAGYVVGEIARRLSAENPTRSVAAAKSWLCHSKVDRHQPILPWQAPAEVAKVSPVTASRRYLEHLVSIWSEKFPDAPLAEQIVVLTVPASFDAAARELTREAALAAGLPANLILLEEPQAAVYAWLTSMGERWRRSVKVGESLLVCDVGGGTSDFTLVGVAEENGELVLRRIAVGNHLLVGGDNMDLALAFHASEEFAKKNVKLDPWQSVSLWHMCRQAKEALLAPGGAETHPLSVLGRGSKLIGGTVSIDLEKQSAAQLLLEGFFPKCSASDRPQKRRMSGFQEIGLPFESDTAVTRHLAAFLTAHGSNGQPVRPSHVLFNGGVFKSPIFRDRLMEVIGEWSPDAPPRVLDGVHDLDHSVARGAAYYGWAKLHGGVRIRGGTARSYYVGIESSGLAIPGQPRPLRALCVVPFGMEEGNTADVPSGEIGLVVGEQATFRFFSSATRKQDAVGELVTHWSDDEIAETDSLETMLAREESMDDDYVPVKFQSHITELGVFELWCVGTKNQSRWKLEFSVRDDAEN